MEDSNDYREKKHQESRPKRAPFPARLRGRERGEVSAYQLGRKKRNATEVMTK
jgi:hypothetical protein